MSRRFIPIIAAMWLAGLASQAAAQQGPEAESREITDAEMIAMTADQCGSDGSEVAEGFDEFFFYFAQNDVVRRHFTAPTVTVTRGGATREVAAADYAGSPVRTMDWYYIAADSSLEAPVYLDVQFAATAEGYRVEWVRAEFDHSSEGDSLGNVVRRFGPRGALNFVRADDGCWRLTGDTVSE